MSYFEDYVQDGLCCESCGGYMGGDEPGYVRMCAGCQPKAKAPAKAKRKRSR